MRRFRSHHIFDPNKIVTGPELSIGDGAIKGWDKRNQYTYQMLLSLSKHYKFDIENHGMN